MQAEIEAGEVVQAGKLDHRPIDINAMLTLQECARWLRIQPRELSARSRGRNARIPAVRLNKRVIRFHPATILAKFAADAGVPVEVIAASIRAKAG